MRTYIDNEKLINLRIKSNTVEVKFVTFTVFSIVCA